ncbi:zinc finger protein 2 homolog [Gigantopelta aegis]|uniref:zinc finger protein 2 homolog n=1 Tax=Gigantopelta aegis TaxID=1735272 RepID=UPI001B888BDD|nr:zinc finger protein 2 homolog [Gigantopelta aegis]XP_041366649.1 zinc finger protein 2 homolog [Gigantopelta aegis]XP_041366650.1 zinc finger protein 2 homolog [Gigantopelta aegis]XP_041366651.1 zinc finger protein 2 homolog [Gigantopelta aegis]
MALCKKIKKETDLGDYDSAEIVQPISHGSSSSIGEINKGSDTLVNNTPSTSAASPISNCSDASLHLVNQSKTKPTNENYLVIQSYTNGSNELESSVDADDTDISVTIKQELDVASSADFSEENSCNLSNGSELGGSSPGEKRNDATENGKIGCLKRVNTTKTSRKAFPCDMCSKTFARHSGLLDHQIVHGRQGKYKCSVCMKSFTSSSNLANHTRVHTGEKPFECEDCSKTFKQMGQLRNHENTHTGQRRFQCDVCRRPFFTMSGMNQHKKCHSGDKPFLCSVCDRPFPLRWQLNQHFRTHTGVKPYKCDQCDKSYPSPSALYVHMKLHTGQKPFHCDTCGKDFIHNWALKMHAKSHSNEKPFKCDLCGQCFADKYYLNRHVKTHMGERRVKCKICFRGFVTQEALTKHLKIHEKKRNFVCDICGKGYFTKNKLTEHYRKHTGDRPEKCDLCGKCFARSDTLRVHRQSHFKPPREVKEGSHGGYRVYGPQARVQPIFIKKLTEEMSEPETNTHDTMPEHETNAHNKMPELKTNTRDIALNLLKVLSCELGLGPEQIKEVASTMIKEVDKQRDSLFSITKIVPRISVDTLVDRTVVKVPKCTAIELDPNQEPVPTGHVIRNFKVGQCYGSDKSDKKGDDQVVSVSLNNEHQMKEFTDGHFQSMQTLPDSDKNSGQKKKDAVRSHIRSRCPDMDDSNMKLDSIPLSLSLRIEPCKETETESEDSNAESCGRLCDDVNLETEEPSFEIDLAEPLTDDE